MLYDLIFLVLLIFKNQLKALKEDAISSFEIYINIQLENYLKHLFLYFPPPSFSSLPLPYRSHD